MKNQFLLFALAIVLFASCSKDSNTVAPTVVEESSLTKGNKGKPFKGELKFSFAPNENLPCDCGDFYPVGTFEGTGNLSHLGKTTSQIKPCVAPIIKDGNYVGDHVGVECAYFEAANGDLLYLYTYPYDLMFTPVGAIGTAKVDFVGGTGRFQNATGSFTGIVTVGQTGATFTNLNGTIYY